ncbi:hypothetical protein BKA67DRAFT_620116, partial [Truncatella angustata]
MEMHRDADSLPLRVLSLDGGGIRGKSSLLILENIMERIRESKGLDRVPKPCDHFDVIGGTSTGGIIAIMLGRLSMTVNECIQAYDKVGQAAFTPKWRFPSPAPPRGAYSARALEDAIKQVVREHCVESPCIGHRQEGKPTAETCPHGGVQFRNRSCTKTVALAITRDNVDAPPTLFKTYDNTTDFEDCAIWQVARATSAATTFFKSIKLGRDAIEFIDAGFGYNNPCRILINEARRQFPERHQLQVLSIGTGLGDVVTIEDSRIKILKALRSMATTSKKVARELDQQYGDGDSYHRFNVDRGLEDITLADWQKASRISAHTKNYLEENQRAIQKFVDGFTRVPRRQAELLATPKRTHYLPIQKNRRFVGREKILISLQQKLFEEQCDEVALFGLGGIGKTQVALQLAHWANQNKPEYSIFWVSALSNGAFDQAYTEIASRLSITSRTDEDLNELVCQYLRSAEAGKWLLIVDNADDTEVLFGPSDNPGGINKFIPKTENGRILFTTRSKEVARGGQFRDTIEIPRMDLQEAILFLKHLSISEGVLQNKEQLTELLEELTYLPLAIAQAAAYLDRHPISIAGYLDLLRSEEQIMVNLMSRKFDDSTLFERSQRAVATTWLVSFDQIQKSDAAAVRLLSFLANIEPKAIPESILPASQSKLDLIDALGTLYRYAFIEKRAEGDLLDMHSLVHLAARVWLKENGLIATTATDAIRHISKIFPPQDFTNRTMWRQYLPHTFRLLAESKGIRADERFDLSLQVGLCLQVDGRIQDAIRRLKETCEWRNQQLSEDHPSRLASQHELAGAYQANGQVKESVELLEHVVKIQSTTLAEDHPNRLASQHQLAKAYQANGQVKESVKLLEHVVKIQSTTLAEDHPSRLASQHELARAYQANGQVKEAVKLLEHVVKIQSTTLTEDHPSRLASQHQLARAYQANGQVKESVKLLEHVVKIESTTLTEDHPDRLASQHELARAYQANGQVKESVELLEHVVKIQSTTLAEDHPSRLASQHELAGAYQANGQVKEAVKLLEHVVKIESTTLTKDHPSRLASQHELAKAYQANGHVKEAVKLLEHVVKIQSTTLTEDHPSRLASQHELAGAYQANGHVNEAVKLLEHVVKIKSTTLAEDHPSRLASQHELAGAYQANGQVKESVELLEHVVKIESTTLAEDHPSRLASQHELARAYQANGQVKESVELLEHVVKIQSTTLAEDHPDRLASQHELARAYQANGQVKESVELLEHVVKIQSTTLAEDHPSRLASQHELAGAYQANGQVKEAVKLLEHVVKIESTTLTKDHPSRLASQHELAKAYQANGHVKEAVKLLEHVVKIQSTTLTEDHPSRLASQHELAGAYQANGHVNEAVKLLEHVVKIKSTTLAEDHPSRLASQHELA